MASATRHPSLSITDEQEANLRTLAAYLLTLPADYPDFEMSSFTSDPFRGAGWDGAYLPSCGTAACAAGHGPAAGILPSDGEDWGSYSHRAFITGGGWDWCFAADWADVDNTVHGAARRILHMLHHGVPENAYEQVCGDKPYLFAREAA